MWNVECGIGNGECELHVASPHAAFRIWYYCSGTMPWGRLSRIPCKTNPMSITRR
jgi:hypothetical protein